MLTNSQTMDGLCFVLRRHQKRKRGSRGYTPASQLPNNSILQILTAQDYSSSFPSMSCSLKRRYLRPIQAAKLELMRLTNLRELCMN
jgi:hypothetical protein